MEINKEWLEEHEACDDGIDWFVNYYPNNNVEAVELVKHLAGHRFDWANWLISQCLTRQQRIVYAIYAAEQVIDIFEKKYPDDNRPRKAIEAAKEYIENPSKETAIATNNAADAARCAVYTAYYAFAYKAANAADAARCAAEAIAIANAAYTTANAACAVADEIKDNIITYGIKLMEAA